MMRSFTVLFILAFSALLATPANAAAFAPADATELQDLMADAQEAQKICYSYFLRISDSNGSESTNEGGASWTTERNANTVPNGTGCTKHIALTANVRYTSAASESEDSAGYGLTVQNLPSRQTDNVLQRQVRERLDISEKSLLDNYDDAVFNAMKALPGIVASLGVAPYLPLEANTAELSAGENLTNNPGSDLIRENQTGIILFSLALLATIAWGAWTIYADRQHKALISKRQARRDKRPNRHLEAHGDADQDSQAEDTNPSNRSPQ